jgi:hypothetical protein
MLALVLLGMATCLVVNGLELSRSNEELRQQPALCCVLSLATDSDYILRIDVLSEAGT